MNEITHALEAYRTFDPAGWVALYRALPMWLGAVLAAFGAFLLLFGGGRAFRVVSGPLGALVGFFFAPVLASKLQLGLSAGAVSLVAAAAIGFLGIIVPPGALFFALGLPAGLAAGQLAGPSDWLLGFAPAFLVAGIVAALLSRYIAAVVSALVGAWVFVIGMLAALHQVGGISQTIAATPWGVIVAAGLFGLAGAVYQLSRPPPEVAEQLRMDELQERKRASEQRALEKRWANYTGSNRKQ